MMKDLLKKAVPAVAMTMIAGLAFAGAPGSMTSQGDYGKTVSQTDQPSPEFCKKNPTDPRCKDK